MGKRVSGLLSPDQCTVLKRLMSCSITLDELASSRLGDNGEPSVFNQLSCSSVGDLGVAWVKGDAISLGQSIKVTAMGCRELKSLWC